MNAALFKVSIPKTVHSIAVVRVVFNCDLVGIFLWLSVGWSVVAGRRERYCTTPSIRVHSSVLPDGATILPRLLRGDREVSAARIMPVTSMRCHCEFPASSESIVDKNKQRRAEQGYQEAPDRRSANLR